MNILFHGPGGKSSAVLDAKSRGLLLCEPLGDKGLKVDDSREINELLSTVPIGDCKVCLVAGPMDKANAKAADALLKTLEDLDHSMFVLNLWSFDITEVQPTIVSRCLHRWCAEARELDLVDDSNVYEKAMSLVEAFRSKDCAELVELTKRDKKDDGDILLEVVRTIPEVLETDFKKGVLQESDTKLWTGVREVLRHRDPTRNELMSVLLAVV